MSYKPHRTYIGCFAAPLALIAGLGAVYVGLEAWDYLRVTDPDYQLAKLNEYVVGFECPGLTVERRVRPYHSSDPWGAILHMPNSCRDDLLARAKKSDRFDRSSDSCFHQRGNWSSQDLCFDGKEVYFGGYRVP